MLRLIRNLVIVLALVVGIAFGFFNFNPVTVDLLWVDSRVPLVIILVVAFVLGFGLALLLLLTRLIGVRRSLRRSQRQLKDAQGEIRNLRSMPIHDA